jgi:hypothetical protein
MSGDQERIRYGPSTLNLAKSREAVIRIAPRHEARRLDRERSVGPLAKEGGNQPRKHRTLAALGRVVLTFLAESVRWMEQAAEALGEKLHGFGVAGRSAAR